MWRPAIESNISIGTIVDFAIDSEGDIVLSDWEMDRIIATAANEIISKYADEYKEIRKRLYNEQMGILKKHLDNWRENNGEGKV